MPSGHWLVIDRAPDPSGGKDKSFWWLMPANEEAHAWAERGQGMKTICVQYPTRQLDPVNRKK